MPRRCRISRLWCTRSCASAGPLADTPEKVGLRSCTAYVLVDCLTSAVMEDAIVLGHMLPKGTTIIIPTATSWEDASTPLYNPDAIPPPTSSTTDERMSASVDVEKSELAVRAAERLSVKRSEGAKRKVGFWEAGTGKQFIPERWLDDQGRFDIGRGPSLPFSLGQRACFGKNLAVS